MIRSVRNIGEPGVSNGAMQRTIERAVTLSGVGLQTGKAVSMTLRPSPTGSGVNFVRTDIPNRPLLNVRSLDLQGGLFNFARRTTLGTGPLQIQTTEHLLAALSGLSIDNIVVELDNEELPGFDGSAKDFVDLIKSAGYSFQDAPRAVLDIHNKVRCESDGASLEITPFDSFKISYTLDYPDPAIGKQYFDITVTEDTFEKDIAGARTFCLEKEVKILLAMGLGKGANYKNTLVLGDFGPIDNELRFPDEPVRHKILDLIGDLYLLGMPVKGHVVAIKSGHKLNMELVKKLKKGV